MEDFKRFLDKVLAPVQGEARSEPAPAEITLPGDGQAPRQTVSHEELERRYVEVMNALLADAETRRAINVFTDVVSWKLAMVANHFGPWAAGEIVRKLGAHLGSIAAADEAQREANRAARAGRRPN